LHIGGIRSQFSRAAQVIGGVGKGVPPAQANAEFLLRATVCGCQAYGFDRVEQGFVAMPRVVEEPGDVAVGDHVLRIDGQRPAKFCHRLGLGALLGKQDSQIVVRDRQAKVFGEGPPEVLRCGRPLTGGLQRTGQVAFRRGESRDCVRGELIVLGRPLKVVVSFLEGDTELVVGQCVRTGHFERVLPQRQVVAPELSLPPGEYAAQGYE
jgi:hypothetical protein